MPETNLSASTRELWLRTMVDEVFMALPLTAMLMEHRRISFKGGTKIKKTVTKATMTSLAQNYSSNEPLEGGNSTILGAPEFGWKKFQIPLEYGVDEELQNKDADAGAAPADIVQAIVEGGQYAAREHLSSMAYATTTGETGKVFQGLACALTHDTVYGGYTRTIGSTLNTWFQGASADLTYTDWDTACAATIANFRRYVAACRRYAPKNRKLYAFVGESLYQAFQSQCEARMMNTKPAAGAPGIYKYGFNTLWIDGVELVLDSYLTTASRTAAFYIIDPETWELRISPKRNFKVTPFVWQGDMNDGLDVYLARMLVAGNLVCWQPNANIYRSAMT